MGIEFGYYPQPLDVRAGDVSIATLPGHAERVAEVQGAPEVDSDWIYAPPQQTQRFPSGEIVTRPYSARVFGLPKTHRLELATSDDSGRLAFLVHCFGFFTGMRMTQTEAGFLDATPLRPGALNDFVLVGHSLEVALQAADAFWVRNSARPELAATLVGAIHSLFLAQTRNLLSFEQFIYAYTAIEGAFVVGRRACGVPNAGGHAQRIRNLCDAFGIAPPIWATDEMWLNVVNVRNNMFHEGLFLQAPLGFETYQGVEYPDDVVVTDEHRRLAAFLPQAMVNLICRFIVALLGLQASDYLKSDVNSRARQPLEL